MNANDFFGEALEAGQTVVKKANDQVKVTAQTAKGQITGASGASPQQPGGGAPDAQAPQPQDGAAAAMQQKATQDFIQDLYGASNMRQGVGGNGTPPANGQAPQQTQQVQDQQKLMAARGKLQQHLESYYRPTFEPPKQQEERAADKIEREEAEEMQELQVKQAEKPKNLALDRAQRGAEVHRGAAG